MMDAVKPLISSKGALGSLIAALAALAALGGVVVSVEDQQMLVDNLSVIIIAVVNIVGVISALVGFVGRLRAKTQIGGILTPDPTKVTDPAMLSRSSSNILKP